MQRHARRCCRAWVLMFGLLFVALVPAGAALAQQPTGPQGQSLLTPDDRAAMAQIFWHRAQATLGLTDQQVTDIRALLDAQRTAAQANVQNLIAARKQLRTLLAQPNADPAAIQSAAAQVKTLQGQLFDQRLQTQLALRSKLTPDQLAQWIVLRQGMRHRWMGRGRAFGPGML